jgi:uncharacterized protein
MAFSLIPREMKFFDMFEEASAIITRASEQFLDMLTHFDRGPNPIAGIQLPASSGAHSLPLGKDFGGDRVAYRCEELRQAERACDLVVERIIKALDVSFITPFDREDIHTLATSLDDVMDNMEETAHRFFTFRIEQPPPAAVTLARIIRDCCRQLEQAVRQCRSMKDIQGIHNCLREITKLENEADQIYRESDAGLFANPPEVLHLIKLRELYGWLEDTVDACKSAAMIISEIVIKGS